MGTARREVQAEARARVEDMSSAEGINVIGDAGMGGGSAVGVNIYRGV